MSLINRVLEDLERNRPAEAAEVPGNSSITRAVSRRRPSLVLPISVAAVAGAAVALFFVAGPASRIFAGDGAQKAAQVAAPAAKPVPKPVVVAAAAPAPAALPASAAVSAPVPVATVAPAAAPAASVAIAAASTKAVVASAPKPEVVAVAKPPVKTEAAPVAKAVVAASKPAIANSAPTVVAAAPPVSAPAAPVKVARASAEVVAREEPPRAYTAPIKTVSPQQQSENLYREAVVLLQQGRWGEATDTLTKSLQLQPGNVTARKELASLQLQRGNVDQALATLDEGRRMAPSNPELAMAVARIELERGNAQRAEDLLEQVASATQTDPRTHAMQAVALQRLGRNEEAVAQFLQALQSNPGMPTWLVGLGISLRAINKPAEAYEAFARAKSTGLLSAELSNYVDQQLQALAK